MKKYNYTDDFEMVYLRHEYANKCIQMNGDYVKEFMGVIHKTAHLMFDKLYPNFSKIGFDREDVLAITQMYAIYYMELYSIRNNENNKDRYFNRFFKKHQKHPSNDDVKKYDRNSMINFLRQRLQHLSTLCARKARNITVGIDRRMAFASTKTSKKVNESLLLEDHEKYGYRKVNQIELSNAKQRAKLNQTQNLEDDNGFSIVEVEILNNGISVEDYFLLFQNHDNELSKNPEEQLLYLENERETEMYRNKFNGLEQSKKRRRLKDFIKKHDGDTRLKKELTLAKKFLSRKEIMV